MQIQNMVALHPLVEALVPDPNAPIPNVRLIGYIGRSSKESNVRLYEALSNLAQWVDLPKDGILCTANAPPAAAPHEATYVWVRADSVIELPAPSPTTAARFQEDKSDGEFRTQGETQRLYAPSLRRENGPTDGGTSTGGTAGGTGG